MPKVIIPTALKQYADGHEEVEVAGATVDTVLTQLTTRFPDLRRHLYNDAGAMRNFVNIYVNDEDARYLNRGATGVSDADVVSIIPAIAGGVDTAARRIPAVAHNGHTTLDRQELQRYSRHLLVPEVGLEGQKK